MCQSNECVFDDQSRPIGVRPLSPSLIHRVLTSLVAERSQPNRRRNRPIIRNTDSQLRAVQRKRRYGLGCFTCCMVHGIGSPCWSCCWCDSRTVTFLSVDFSLPLPLLFVLDTCCDIFFIPALTHVRIFFLMILTFVSSRAAGVGRELALCCPGAPWPTTIFLSSIYRGRPQLPSSGYQWLLVPALSDHSCPRSSFISSKKRPFRRHSFPSMHTTT